MSTEVKTTKDYKIFKELPGNRKVDTQHVKELIRSLTSRGNLINNFPIVVNENMEIIDGQHRLAALKELGWEVAYRVEEGLTINTVRDINSAQRNWNWRDYAVSYMELGNDNYRRLLQMGDLFQVGYHVLTQYCGLIRDRVGKPGHGQGNLDFRDGEMILTPEMMERASVLLTQAKEITSSLVDQGGIKTAPHTLWAALYVVFQSPDYDHKRMLIKVKHHGLRLKMYNLINDQLRDLEDLYNFNVKDGSEPVRLF